MMKINTFTVIAFFILFCSCDNNKKVITVWIENNSDIDKAIEMSTFFNDSLIDKRIIKKDSIADRVSPFKLELAVLSKIDTIRLRFASSKNEETSCLIPMARVDKGDLIHVNYEEKLFRKGSYFDNIILQKDTVVRKEFYCEIISAIRK